MFLVSLKAARFFFCFPLANLMAYETLTDYHKDIAGFKLFIDGWMHELAFRQWEN